MAIHGEDNTLEYRKYYREHMISPTTENVRFLNDANRGITNVEIIPNSNTTLRGGIIDTFFGLLGYELYASAFITLKVYFNDGKKRKRTVRKDLEAFQLYCTYMKDYDAKEVGEPIRRQYRNSFWTQEVQDGDHYEDDSF